MDAKQFNGSDDRYDDQPRDWSLPPLERCAVCQVPIERVSIAVHTTPHHSVVVCSEICQKDLEARRGGA